MSVEVIRALYHGLQRRDVAAIAACYHPEAVFRDEVFDLRGRRVPAMWHMLVEGGKDMAIEFRDVRSEGERGSAHWEARYSFSSTGRKVHNVIESEFRFEDGLIVEQRDRFPFWRWSRMALGMPGLLLGWTPFLRAKVRKRAAANLAKFLTAHPEYRNP